MPYRNTDFSPYEEFQPLPYSLKPVLRVPYRNTDFSPYEELQPLPYRLKPVLRVRRTSVRTSAYNLNISGASRKKTYPCNTSRLFLSRRIRSWKNLLLSRARICISSTSSRSSTISTPKSVSITSSSVITPLVCP